MAISPVYQNAVQASLGRTNTTLWQPVADLIEDCISDVQSSIQHPPAARLITATPMTVTANLFLNIMAAPQHGLRSVLQRHNKVGL